MVCSCNLAFSKMRQLSLLPIPPTAIHYEDNSLRIVLLILDGFGEPNISGEEGFFVRGASEAIQVTRD